MPRSACTVDPCDKPNKAKGLCSKHLSRLERHGSATARLKGEIVNDCRVCPRCEVDKPLAEWGTNKATKTGISAYCKACMGDVQQDHRAKPGFVRSPRNAAKERDFARRYRTKHPGRIRSWAAIYRARKQSATVEKFDVREIFVRDGWICHICRVPIDPAVRYPDTASVSIDHVIPLSRGGAHSRENCAAAHLVCNIRKKDRMEAAACAR